MSLTQQGENRERQRDADLGLHFHTTKDPSEPCPTEMGDTKSQPLLLVYSLHPTLEDIFEEDFLAIKLHERLGSGARVEIPCSGLSFGVTPSLSKPQPTVQHLMLCIRTKGNTCTLLDLYTEAESPFTASLPLPSLSTWIRTSSQSLL